MDYSALKALITAHEGIRALTYKDTMGKRTVGVGFNLDAPGAQANFRAALPTVNYTNVLNRLVSLTKEQIDALLDYSINLAIEGAKEIIPSFDTQPEQVQMVVVDMIFNMGAAGVAKFVRFLAAIEREDYVAAVAQLQLSAWRHQVGVRASDDIALLGQLLPPPRDFAAKEAPVSAVQAG